MNYPVRRKLWFLAFAWHMLAMRLRLCRHSESLMTWRSGWAGGSQAKTTCNNLRTSGSVIPVSVFFPQTPFLQHQEPQRQHHQGHVVVIAPPTTHLVVVQTHFLFATQKTVFHRPAIVPRLRHLQQRTIGSGV